MQIENEILIKWNAIRHGSDVTYMAEMHGVSKVSLYKALQTGKCSARVYAILRKFYQRKQKHINNTIATTDYVNE